MTTIFLDTSAFLKLYIPENGSAWLKAYTNGQRVIISELVLFESANTLARLYRKGIYTKRQASIIYAQILGDTGKYLIDPIGGRLQLNKVASLSFNSPAALRLRTLDSVHLAEAKARFNTLNQKTPPEPLVFVSSDVQLLKVAQAVGLTVENPEDYANSTPPTPADSGQ